MKLSDLPIDAVQSGDTFIVVSNGESQRIPIASLIFHLKNNLEFMDSIARHPVIRAQMEAQLLNMLRDAGLDVKAAGQLVGERAGMTSSYVVPGQQLIDTDAEVEIVGDVEIREE